MKTDDSRRFRKTRPILINLNLFETSHFKRIKIFYLLYINNVFGDFVLSFSNELNVNLISVRIFMQRTQHDIESFCR